MSNTEEFVNLLHKEMEQFIDEGYDKLDQQEYEMQEIGLIMHGQSDYYWQYPDEYEKDKKICELENEVERLKHRLSNCIEPKFKIGQKIYVIGTEKVEEVEYFGENIDGIITFEEGCRCGCTPDRYSVEKRENVFATEEEARAKLEELKNG